MAATNIDELASQLIQQIGSYFERISASPSRAIAQFPDDNQSNYLYVLYSASGMPLHAGCVVGNDGRRGRGPRELQSLTSSGAVGSFRTVELGDENLAMQLDRLIRELFHTALPFAEQPMAVEAVAGAAAGTGRRRGRPPGSGKGNGRRRGRRAAQAEDAGGANSNGRRRGRPAKKGAATVAGKRGPGRPRKNTAEAVEAPRRGPGRPRKSEAAAEAPRRRPGRPRKNEAAEAAAPRRRGRPRKNAAAEGGANG
jgi:hypothetical protein